MIFRSGCLPSMQMYGSFWILIFSCNIGNIGNKEIIFPIEYWNLVGNIGIYEFLRLINDNKLTVNKFYNSD